MNGLTFLIAVLAFACAAGIGWCAYRLITEVTERKEDE